MPVSQQPPSLRCQIGIGRSAGKTAPSPKTVITHSHVLPSVPTLLRLSHTYAHTHKRANAHSSGFTLVPYVVAEVTRNVSNRVDVVALLEPRLKLAVLDCVCGVITSSSSVSLVQHLFLVTR